MKTCDFLIIGGGIIGLTLARELKQSHQDASIILIEKEPRVGLHASGRNSGVLHAGFYYTADSLKAKLCRDGNRALTEYCLEHNLRINRCGKLVVATNEEELNTLGELFRRGEQNQVQLERLTEKEAQSIESKVFTIDRAMYSPNTSSVDPNEVVNSLYEEITQLGVQVIFNSTYLKKDNKFIHTSNDSIQAGYVINTAGLYADKIAHDFGFSQDYVILPFKGLYLYAKEGSYKLNTNVYPVPDLKNPFLGVHFTVTVDCRCKIGPTAIPAFWRENYLGFDNFNLMELAQILKLDMNLFIKNEFSFRQLAFTEMQKYSRKKLLSLAHKLVNELDEKAFSIWGKPGIRAQLVNLKNNTLEMDFKYEGDDKSFHVLNAVSPAFTCSIPFSKLLLKEIEKRLK